MATSAVLRLEVVNGHHPSADNAMAEYGLCTQTAERSPWHECRRALARPHTPRPGVRAEREIEDRRVAWQARTATQDLRKGQIVGPDKCQPFVKSLELVPRALDARIGPVVRTP